MPGGGKKAVFPPLNLHEHHEQRGSQSMCPDHHQQERQKKLLQARGKSVDQKDSPEKEKEKLERQKNQGNSSKSDQQKTPTKEQKDLLKQEQQRLKNEQKAQQKLEKEQLKHEKEMQKEQHKLEKEQHKLEKEQLKLEKEQQKAEQKSPSKNCFKLAVDKNGAACATPVLKTQKSIDVSSIKHQPSFEGHRPPARNSVDLQYTRDVLNQTPLTDESADVSPYSSTTALSKLKTKK